MILQRDKFYWMRDKKGIHWRPCRVFGDADDNLWMAVLGYRKDIRIDMMNLDVFEFRELEEPDG